MNLSHCHTTPYYPEFSQLTGSVSAGLFLSQLLVWSKEADESWVCKTQAEWEKATGLTLHQQATARRKLRDIGLVEEVKRGLPCKTYYRANLARLQEMLSSVA